MLGKWTQEQTETARKMRMDGCSYKDIGRAVGKKENTVAGYVNLHPELFGAPGGQRESFKEALCWTCARSGTSTCCWDKKFEPVDGWRAKAVFRNGIGHTYHVMSCPEYVEDGRWRELFQR